MRVRVRLTVRIYTTTPLSGCILVHISHECAMQPDWINFPNMFFLYVSLFLTTNRFTYCQKFEKYIDLLAFNMFKIYRSKIICNSDYIRRVMNAVSWTDMKYESTSFNLSVNNCDPYLRYHSQKINQVCLFLANEFTNCKTIRNSLRLMV